jgi:hypothetical protein
VDVYAVKCTVRAYKSSFSVYRTWGEVITKRAFAKTIVKGYVAALLYLGCTVINVAVGPCAINAVPESPQLNSHVQDVYAAET